MASQQYAFSQLRELVNAVARYCSEGRTGTLMAVTQSNSFLRMIISTGNIIYLEY